MTMWDGPPQPPVRQDVVEALRRFHPSHASLSRRERKLLQTATPAELLTAELEALWDAPNSLVEMADGTMAKLPDDPDRA